jgi:type 1 fimbria pilin
MTTETRATSWTLAAFVACVLAAHLSASPAPHDAAAAAGSVNVTVKFTGKGVVDQNHRLWVWLFDTPQIGPDARPVGELSLDENGGDVTFTGVGEARVWIAVAYDVNGGFSGQAPPPSGSPVALHATDTGAPAAVTPGEGTTVGITFDDSFRMP